MGQYVANRLVQLVFVLIGVSVVVFVTMHLLPGDVAELLLGDHATNAQLERLRQQLGLDQPVWIQYLRFVRDALGGDLGTSILSNHPALQDVLVGFPVTLQLTLSSLLLASLVGVPVGVMAAIWQGSRFDGVVMTLTLFGVSMPIFWLGLMLLVLFAAALGWLPVGGLMPVGLDPPRVTGMSIIDSLLAGDAEMIAASIRHMILPTVTLASVPLALITRITRAEVLAAAQLDHVRTARAKGLETARVVMRHILRNAAIPIVTVIGLQLGLLLSGAVLTETIYSLPGLGRLMVELDPVARLPGGPGRRHVHRGTVRRGQSASRPQLRHPRSADQPGMSATALPQHAALGRQGTLRRALRGTGARIGLGIAVIFLLVTATAPLLAPYDPFDQDLSSALSPPSFEHFFGADQYGRDMFSRILFGTRTALLAIVMADGLALLLGGSLGLIAGFTGGRVDALIMRVVDVLLAFPYLLLALIIVAALGPSLTNSVIAIAIIYTPQYARLMRGQVLKVQTADFVVAAQAVGGSRLRVMLRHVLPNSFTPVLVLATLQSGAVVVETAGLSFLGLGAQPPSPDWGALLADGHGYFLSAWWIATFPGLAIFCVVIGFNLLGDALRDQFDPQQRRM